MKDKNITTKAQSEIISEEQMEDVLDLMIRSGTIPDPRIDDEKARQAKQEKARKVYHNTLLLFQRYRDIIWVLQSFTTEVATELDQPLSDIDRLLSNSSSTRGRPCVISSALAIPPVWNVLIVS